MPKTLYHGTLIHSLSLTQLETVPSALLCVDDEGVIEWIERDVDMSRWRKVAEGYGLRVGEKEEDQVTVVRLGQGEFLCPGFVDTHTHAPQYPNNGLGGSLQLLDWLDQVTFPEEKKYRDLEYARRVYDQVVRRTLDAGTTTSCYYATLHLEASVALAEICLEKGRFGQRAFVGKCCMDRNCPEDYVESSSSSITETKTFIDRLTRLTFPKPISRTVSSSSLPARSSLPPLVQPIITPRFALSCTESLLTSLGELAASFSPSLAIQTHLSENTAEIRRAIELFPDCHTYAGVYEKYKLLGPGTILAHCVYLSDEERVIIKRTGAGVSHCPTSNVHLKSGTARVRDMVDMGIKVGLGTDCSGGRSIGILSAIREASSVSRCLEFAEPHYRSLSTIELFFLATLGGASLCRLDHRIGNFLPGKEFDALRIKPQSPGMWTSQGESEESAFEKWLWCGDERDVADVWVRGRRVGGVDEKLEHA